MIHCEFSLGVYAGDGTQAPVINNPPQISNQSLTIQENTNLTITLGPLTDGDGDNLTYTVTGSSDYQNGSQANQIVFNSSMVGQQTLNVSVSDGKNGSDTAIISVDVIQTPVSNTAPVLSDQTLSVDENTDLTVTLGPLTDADGDILDYTVTGSSDFTLSGAENQIVFNSASLGTQNLNVSVSDGKGGNATSTITITVNDVNTNPVISNQALMVNENANLTITLGPLTDSDGDNLTYTVTGSSDFQNGSQANQIVFNSSVVGQQTLNVSVSDGNGGSDTATITITVNSVNANPVISNQTITVDQNTDMTITLGPLTDSDGDNLTYAVTGSSDFQNGSQANQIVFNSSTVGGQTLNVSVSDANGGSDTAVISITVNQVVQPAGTNIVVNMNQGETKTVTLGDASNTDGTITYTLDPADYTVTGNTVSITANTGGTHFYTVTANDGNGPDVTFQLRLNVVTLQAEPTLVDTIGWSLVMNAENGDASLENGVNHASVPYLLETMFNADGINHTRNNHIQGPAANMDSLSQQSVLDFISASTAQAILVSGHSSGIGLNPSGPPSWRDDYDTVATAIKNAGKNLIWYQGWLHNDNANWGNTNVVDNFNYLKTTHGGTMIKTYEAFDHFRVNYPAYFNTIEQGYGVYPVTELFADSVHGTYAGYYLATLCLYRALTGKLCSTMLYEPPALYQLDADLKAKIFDTVDLIQDETYPGVDLQPYGSAYQEIWLSAGPSQGTLAPNSETVNQFNMGSQTSIALSDYKGAATGITATIPATIYGGSNAVASAVGENSGFLPDALMDYVDFHDASAIVLTLSGLTPNATYQFKGTGSRTGSGTRGQDWTIGGATYSFDATENRDAGVTANFTADGSGNAVLTLDKSATSGNGWVYFCGAIISKGTKPVVYDTEIISNVVEVV